MKKLYEILAFLVCFLGALATGKFGWSRTLSIVNLIFWQTVFVTTFMSTGAFGTFAAITLLTVVHFVCGFLAVLRVHIDSKFTRNKPDFTRLTREHFWLSLGISGILSAVILAIIADITATPFLCYIAAVILTSASGAAISITGAFARHAAESPTPLLRRDSANSPGG